MDFGTITSDNIIHALIMRRKMELNKYVKVVKLIESEQRKSNLANERTKLSFMQSKQRRRKEWWRMDNHFRESLRKELDVSNFKLNKSPTRNEHSISSSNSVTSTKLSEFNLPMIINNNEADMQYYKKPIGVPEAESEDYSLPKIILNNTSTERSQLKKPPIMPLTPHNTPQIMKPVLVHTSQVSHVPLALIQNKGESKTSLDLANDKNENSSSHKSADEKENTRRPLSVNLLKVVSQRKATSANETLPPIKPEENAVSADAKYAFSSLNEFPDINSHQESSLNTSLKAASEQPNKISNSKRNDAKKLMKSRILNTKKQEKYAEDSDDYQSMVSRFLWKTPFHVETSNTFNKLEAETISIKRQISKQKSLSLTRDNRYNNLLKTLNEKID